MTETKWALPLAGLLIPISHWIEGAVEVFGDEASYLKGSDAIASLSNKT